MTQGKVALPAARGGVTIICFLVIILGQGWLLHDSPGALLASTPFVLEMVFCIAMVIGIVICWVRPMGWGTKAGSAVALALFVLYAAATIIHYDVFAAAYLAKMDAQHASAGGALVGLKLTLALIGVTAGIPTIAPIDGREYARRMKEKLERQNAQYAAASVRGAQKDLNATVQKLRESLSDEEMATLLAQLQQDSTGVVPSAAEEAPAAPAENTINPEDWHGWGNGM